MAVRSRLLVAGVTTTGGAAGDPFTVESGRTAVVRTIVLRAVSATDRLATILIKQDGQTAVALWKVLVPASGQYISDHWYTIGPGGSLSWGAETGQVNVSAYGAYLLGAPS